MYGVGIRKNFEGYSKNFDKEKILLKLWVLKIIIDTVTY